MTEIITKLVISNVILVFFAMGIESKFSLDFSKSKLAIVFNFWAATTIFSVPTYIIYLIWFL